LNEVRVREYKQVPWVLQWRTSLFYIELFLALAEACSSGAPVGVLDGCTESAEWNNAQLLLHVPLSIAMAAYYQDWHVIVQSSYVWNK